MSARAIGSGTIAFGMVVIPVQVFPSIKGQNAIRFNRLHESCKGRLKQQNYCPECDVIASNDETVKGYEFAKGQYVVMSAEELKAVEAQSTGEIQIEEFIPIRKIDTIYFDKGYYLGYAKGAQRAYSLLHAALKTSKLAAVAKYSARGKEHLVLLRPTKEGLVLQQLNHAEDIRSFSEIECELSEIKPEELEMAQKVIEQSVKKKFSPKKYKDEMRAKIQGIIDKKVEGKEIAMPAEAAPRAQVVDLMSALKASLTANASAAEKPEKKKKAGKEKAG